jgi:MFS family permease
MPVLLLVLLGTLAAMKNTDSSLGGITLPSAAEAFGLSASMQAFAASITTLALAASALPFGSLSDRLGRRRILTIALCILIAGDLLATVAPGTALFVLGRAVAGVGLGGVFGCAFALVPRVAPGALTSGALGIWNAAIMPMALLMQLLGSLLAEADWRLAYLTMPIVAVPLLVASRARLPETDREGRPANPPALVAIASAILVFLSGISLLANDSSSPWAWACIVAGLALFGFWVLLEKRSAHPTFPVSLLVRPLFIGAVIAGMLFNIALGLLTLQLANFWEYLDGYRAVTVTLGLLPVTVVAAGGSYLVGRLLSRGVRAGLLMPIGLVVCGLGFFSLLLVTVHSSYLVFVPALLLVPAGIALVTVPQSQVFVGQAPPGYMGAVTASRITFGQLGYSVGLALSVALIAIGANVDFPKLLQDAGVNPVRAGTALADVQQYAALKDGKDVPAARAVVTAAGGAYVDGFRLAMLAFGSASVIGAVAVALLSRAGRRREPARGGPVA